MARQCIAIETSVPEVIIGRTYAYLHKGKLCIGIAIKHPCKEGYGGYTWAMKNIYTGKIQYPYQVDIVVPNSRFYEVTSQIVLEGYEEDK